MKKIIIQKEKKKTNRHTSKQTNKKQKSSICKRMETYINLKHFRKSWAFQ